MSPGGFQRASTPSAQVGAHPSRWGPGRTTPPWPGSPSFSSWVSRARPTAAAGPSRAWSSRAGVGDRRVGRRDRGRARRRRSSGPRCSRRTPSRRASHHGRRSSSSNVPPYSHGATVVAPCGWLAAMTADLLSQHRDRLDAAVAAVRLPRVLLGLRRVAVARVSTASPRQPTARRRTTRWLDGDFPLDDAGQRRHRGDRAVAVRHRPRHPLPAASTRRRRAADAARAPG